MKPRQGELCAKVHKRKNAYTKFDVRMYELLGTTATCAVQLATMPLRMCVRVSAHIRVLFCLRKYIRTVMRHII